MKPENRKYQDADDNVYGVEKASNGRYVVIRTNSGGNRKGMKNFDASFSAEVVQCGLDRYAAQNGWKEVPA